MYILYNIITDKDNYMSIQTNDAVNELIHYYKQNFIDETTKVKLSVEKINSTGHFRFHVMKEAGYRTSIQFSMKQKLSCCGMLSVSNLITYDYISETPTLKESVKTISVRLIEMFAELMSYSAVNYTAVGDTKNILEEAGWDNVLSWKNIRTDNTIHLLVKNIDALQIRDSLYTSKLTGNSFNVNNYEANFDGDNIRIEL